MFHEDSLTYLFIGNATHGVASSTTTKYTSIATGSVALVAEATGYVVPANNSSAITSGKYRLVSKLANGQFVFSPVFDMAKVSAVGQSYTAATEQVSYWGYNGTSGSLGTITNGNTYTLHVELKQTAPMLNNTPLIKTIPWKATAATQANVAAGLDEIFDKVFKREPYPMIKVERVLSVAGSDTSAGTISVVKGSPTIVISPQGASTTDAGKYDTDNSTIAVGDYIRFSAATEALTDPVYRVAAATIPGTAGSSATITLDRPYKGSTNTAVAANTVSVVAAANVAAGSFGLKFTGLDRFATVTFNPRNDTYSKVSFAITSEDFDSNATFTTSTLATLGLGTYYQVASLEQWLAGNEGIGLYYDRVPQPVFRGQASSSETYDITAIETYDDNFVNATTGIKPVSKFRLLIAQDSGLSGEGIDNAFGVTV